jgi:hypothetical protein
MPGCKWVGGVPPLHPTFEELGGTLLSYGLQQKGKISLFRAIFYEEFEIYVKKAL